MKKIVLICALAISSLMASANFAKTSLANTYSLDNHVSVVTDSVVGKTPAGEIIKIKQELSRIAFYDIERITINNEHNCYVRIEDGKGNTVVETHDSIDINLPAGTYFVYTTAPNLIGSYK